MKKKFVIYYFFFYLSFFHFCFFQESYNASPSYSQIKIQKNLYSVSPFSIVAKKKDKKFFANEKYSTFWELFRRKMTLSRQGLVNKKEE